jgi:hypothetical protein
MFCRCTRIHARLQRSFVAARRCFALFSSRKALEDSVSSGSHSRSALLYLSLLLSTIRPPETIGTMVWKKSPSRDLKALSAQGTLREVHYVSQMKTGVWKIIRHFYVDQTENIGTHML